jgi:hypothetical protein
MVKLEVYFIYKKYLSKLYNLIGTNIIIKYNTLHINTIRMLIVK